MSEGCVLYAQGAARRSALGRRALEHGLGLRKQRDSLASLVEQKATPGTFVSFRRRERRQRPEAASRAMGPRAGAERTCMIISSASAMTSLTRRLGGPGLFFPENPTDVSSEWSRCRGGELAITACGDSALSEAIATSRAFAARASACVATGQMV